MRLARPAIVLLGCLIAGRPSSGKAPAPPASFVVAVSQGETLLPLARYESGRWVNTWPKPDWEGTLPPLANVPIEWLGRRVPLAWTLWFTVGGTAPQRVAGIEHPESPCYASPTLQVRTAPKWRDDLYDDVHPGLATTDGAAVGAIRMLRSPRSSEPTADALLQRIQPVVESLFHEHEGRAISRPDPYRGEKTATLTAQQLPTLTPTTEWLYRTVADSPSVLYFEASKRSPPTFTHRLAVRGWLRLDRGKLVPVGIEASVELDDSAGPNGESFENRSDLIPLGVVRAGTQDVWVMEVPFGETNSFSLRDVGAGSGRVLLDIDAGGC